MLRFFVMLIPALFALARPAVAEPPVAVVEAVSGVGDVSPMDYLSRGRTVALGPQGRIVISYLDSCLRETVSGGTIVVGARQSVSRGATIVRETIACDGGRLALSQEQARKAAVIVFRGASVHRDGAH